MENVLELLSAEWLSIAAVIGLLWLVLVAFIKEWASPDVIAMTAFCLVIVCGLLSPDEAFNVFSNPAPVTIGAMFILSAALDKTGVIDFLGRILNVFVRRRVWLTLPVLMLAVAAPSAFVNNTPVVAVSLPVILAVCRRKHISPSKLLIPLSYAAVLGGCCTLMGTSTNILASGIAIEHELEPLGMFEFTRLGIVLLGVGVVYVSVIGPWLLPDRLSVSSVLGPEERRQFLCHVLLKPQSPLVGELLAETPLADHRNGFRIIEVRRSGARLALPLNEIRINPYDRVLLAVSASKMERVGSGKETLSEEVAETYGIENLSTVRGGIIEGVVAAHSQLIGKTLKAARFRQTYGMLVLGVHRGGRNLSSDFKDAELVFGDTLLMLGPLSTFAQLRDEGDFMLLEDQRPPRGNRKQATLALLALAGVVAVSALNILPIAVAATAACVLVLWFRCLSPQEAYQAIDWTILLMLYGMLGLGRAMEATGTAAWLAQSVVGAAETWIPPEWLPYVILSLFYLLGSMMTEVLSNNATAVILAPIAISSATSLGLDPRPFVFAVAFSSSAAFSTPIGYQTHMMVYGAGGYRFSDFVRFGLPLNFILWLVATFYIPRIWPF